MAKFSDLLKKVGKSIISGIRRFPAAVGISAAIMVLALILNHSGATMPESAIKWLTRIIMTLGLGIPLSVALQLYLERRRIVKVMQFLLHWAALAALLVVYLFILLPGIDRPMYAIRFISLLVAAVTLVPAVPYLFGPRGDERFALKLLLRLLITGIFTGILIGGIFLMLLMLEKLLAVHLWDKAYSDVAIVCFGIFTPSFLLAGVPRSDENFETEPFQPLVRILLGYIAYPLLAAYTAVIYAYFVRILLQWSWPSNMLVNMVLWYTAIGVLALYFMRGQNAANRWFAIFDRWYPRLTVLPITLMFAGLFIRIGAYGFTESRYFVLVAALWVAAVTALSILFKPEKRPNTATPALIVALAALAVLGPWSAFGVSSASQNARLENLLRRNSMLSASGGIVAKQDVPDGDKRQIYSILDYFESKQELEKAKALPPGATIATLPQALGFDRPAAPGTPNQGIYINSNLPVSLLDVAGYDYIFLSQYSTVQSSRSGDVEMAVDGNSIFTVKKNGAALYTKDLKEYAKGYESAYVQGKQYSTEELTKKDGNDFVDVTFVFSQININYTNNTAEYMVPGFYALVKLK